MVEREALELGLLLISEIPCSGGMVVVVRSVASISAVAGDATFHLHVRSVGNSLPWFALDRIFHYLLVVIRPLHLFEDILDSHERL